ncbi:hypothetical protein E4T56_gene19386 [Termitomyces sp. T112]|nr:hypothetical protein E4T56_gene19386 [Termitomyces sp. T112]
MWVDCTPRVAYKLPVPRHSQLTTTSSLTTSLSCFILSMTEHKYKFDVKMTCSGCSGAVSRVLNKAKDTGDVSDYSVLLDTQEVLVTSRLPYDDILAKIQKTGKEVRSGTTVA